MNNTIIIERCYPLYMSTKNETNFAKILFNYCPFNNTFYKIDLYLGSHSEISSFKAIRYFRMVVLNFTIPQFFSVTNSYIEFNKNYSAILPTLLVQYLIKPAPYLFFSPIHMTRRKHNLSSFLYYCYNPQWISYKVNYYHFFYCVFLGIRFPYSFESFLCITLAVFK